MELTLKNKPLHEYLREHAQRTPEKAAVIYYGKELSYGELDLFSDKLASFLYEKGIRKGDKVALFMQNSPQYIISHFAVQKIGGIVGPCNPMFKEWELEYELNDLKAKALITLDHLYPTFHKIQQNTNVETVIISNYADMLPDIPVPEFPEQLSEKVVPEEAWDLTDILLTSKQVEYPEIEIEMDNDVGLVVYTSGTTGSPKGAMLTFKNAEFKTCCVTEHYGYTEKDICLAVMPIFHIAGMLVGMTSPIASGATIVLLARFNPKTTIQAIEKYEVTVAYTTTPMNVEMMKQQNFKNTNFKSLRMNLCTSFGIQVSEEISDEWQQTTGVSLFEFAYGMSETHTGDSLMPPEAIKYGTVGKPTFDTKIKIVDLENSEIEVDIGEQGEILVSSPSVFKGYMDKPEATSHSLVDGWFHTGDIGKFDKEGYLYFLGRNKEMIKCSGYSVFPEEVEKMMVKHPKISQAAVIGIPDEVRGESVKAFIVLNEKDKGTVAEAELIAWAKEKMAAYKYPREIEFIDELPQTSAGKLLRRLLKKEEKVN